MMDTPYWQEPPEKKVKTRHYERVTIQDGIRYTQTVTVHGKERWAGPPFPPVLLKKQ
jgi:hypothetical protein